MNTKTQLKKLNYMWIAILFIFFMNLSQLSFANESETANLRSEISKFRDLMTISVRKTRKFCSGVFADSDLANNLPSQIVAAEKLENEWTSQQNKLRALENSKAESKEDLNAKKNLPAFKFDVTEGLQNTSNLKKALSLFLSKGEEKIILNNENEDLIMLITELFHKAGFKEVVFQRYSKLNPEADPRALDSLSFRLKYENGLKLLMPKNFLNQIFIADLHKLQIKEDVVNFPAPSVITTSEGESYCQMDLTVGLHQRLLEYVLQRNTSDLDVYEVSLR